MSLHTNRTANLDARVSNRVAVWKEKMRCMAIQDAQGPLSIIERMVIRWEEVSTDPEFWKAAVWLTIAAVVIVWLIVA